MAQSTPTHASGFHLVTVAMTGQCRGNGFNYRSTQQFETRCLNAVKESRSKNMGLYRYDQMVGCLPDGSVHWYCSSLGKSRYSSGEGPAAESTDTQSSPNNMQ